MSYLTLPPTCWPLRIVSPLLMRCKSLKLSMEREFKELTNGREEYWGDGVRSQW